MRSVPLLLCLTWACGSEPPQEHLGNLALGGLQPGAGSQVAVGDPLRLANGDSLVGVDALTRFESDPVEGSASHSCAVYSLRTSGNGFLEGRTTIPCPTVVGAGRAAEFEPVDTERLEPVEPGRVSKLRSALQGASTQTTPAAAAPASVLIRVVTDHGTIEGSVSDVRWPHPDIPEPSLERPPGDLAELWEAVLHPHRYAAN